jgi:hypothetical protein
MILISAILNLKPVSSGIQQFEPFSDILKPDPATDLRTFIMFSFTVCNDKRERPFVCQQLQRNPENTIRSLPAVLETIFCKRKED